jgi:hypothetical protein
VKYAANRPFADPENAARKLIEIANSVEAVQDSRIYIELINGPFLKAGGSPHEYAELGASQDAKTEANLRGWNKSFNLA